MIASIQFRDFRVLEHATLPLDAFNLLLGPNGSGKTTAVRSLLAAGEAARAARARQQAPVIEDLAGATAEFSLAGATLPSGGRVLLRCDQTGALELQSPDGALVEWLAGIRGYVLEPSALAQSCAADAPPVLAANGAGLPAVLAALRAREPARWEEYVGEVRRLLPEIVAIEPGARPDGRLAISVVKEGGLELRAGHLSQGTLVVMALLALALAPERPTLLCLEELERGIHPRLLRDVRDVLYRLSYPQDWGDSSPPVQVLVTTHSPYVLDLFVDTPEDVIIAAKEAGAAVFRRLVDIPELHEMLQSGRLGDLWYTGILGGVP